MRNGTTTQSLIFKARLQAENELKEKRELLKIWEENVQHSMTEVNVLEHLWETGNAEISKALDNAYLKHDRNERIYNKVRIEVNNLEKGIDALETAEWFLEPEW